MWVMSVLSDALPLYRCDCQSHQTVEFGSVEKNILCVIRAHLTVSVAVISSVSYECFAVSVLSSGASVLNS